MTAPDERREAIRVEMNERGVSPAGMTYLVEMWIAEAVAAERKATAERIAAALDRWADDAIVTDMRIAWRSAADLAREEGAP